MIYHSKWAHIGVALVILGWEASCSSTGSNSSDHAIEIDRLVPQTIHARWPGGARGDPGADPGTKEYTSHPLPDARFDCVSLRNLYAGFKLTELRSCMASETTHGRWIFHFKKNPQPIFEYDADKSSSECMAKLAPVLPVPREIFFQSDQEGSLRCYSASLGLKPDSAIDIHIFGDDNQLSFDTPFKALPKNDEEMLYLLATWALTPYWTTDKLRKLRSQIVADSICKACMGEKNFIRPADPRPPQWLIKEESGKVSKPEPLSNQ